MNEQTDNDPIEDRPAAQETLDTPHRQGAVEAGLLGPRTGRRLTAFAFALLLIEFLDELVFGAREAAWPLIRDDLTLNYIQVGVLLGVPNFIANIVEPFIGILGDVWKRRALVLGGGLVYGGALLLAAASGNFFMFLAAMIVLYPASGSFVSLSQATLMDSDPRRHEQNMARWTVAGSLGVVAGSLAVSASSGLGLGWRPLFFGLSAFTFGVLGFAWRFRFPASHEIAEGEQPGFRQGLVNAARALRRGAVLRWLTLLEFSNFMLDTLLGFLALYFVDVVHLRSEQAALAVLVWTAVGLLGDFLLIPLLERVQGLSYLRMSAALELVLFAGFLLVPFVWAKFVLLALLGFFNAGWYSILQGQLYSSMPGQSGTVMTVGNVFGLVAGVIPIVFGLVAEQFGLLTTMWLLILGPIALLVGLPRARNSAPGEPSDG